MEECAQYLPADPTVLKGSWKGKFKELHLEIGCGKGGFITQMAEMNPDIMFVAVEKVENVLLSGLEKTKEMGLENLLFLNRDAHTLCECFGEGEIDRIYLNFSDPWPPASQRDRRLTAPVMLDIYKKIMHVGGEIHMKTDNENLFEYTLFRFAEAGFEMPVLSRDLHATDIPNVMTEYETRFAAEGKKIMTVHGKYVYKEQENKYNED